MYASECSLVQEPEFEDAGLVDKLIDPRFSAERLWDEGELRQVLQHQLAGPVVADMRLLGNVYALEAAQLCEAAVPAIRSYRNVFEHAAPPERLLVLVRRFAHAQLHASEAELPSRVARVLYLLSAAVARARCGRATFGLADDELRAGLESLLGESWLDDPTRELLRRFMPTGGEGHVTEGGTDQQI